MTTLTLEPNLHEHTKKSSIYHFDLETIDENLNYLSMYASIKVPCYEMRHIVNMLHTHGKITISKLIKMLSETKYDAIVLRQYIYVLMFKDIIDFEINEPIHPESYVWVNDNIDEMVL